MQAHEPQTLREQLQTQSDDQLRASLAQLTMSIEAREQELSRLQAEQVRDQTATAIAQEIAAARPGLQDTDFVNRWRSLLDTLNRAEDRYDQLDRALREIMFERQPLIRSDWMVREDNRQTVLALFVPSEPAAREVLYTHLLKLLPVLVNESNPDLTRQAAVLTVHCREISDKEWLTLVAHPARTRFEVLKRWGRDEETIFSGHTLRDAIEFLGEHYAY